MYKEGEGFILNLERVIMQDYRKMLSVTRKKKYKGLNNTTTSQVKVRNLAFE